MVQEQQTQAMKLDIAQLKIETRDSRGSADTLSSNLDMLKMNMHDEIKKHLTFVLARCIRIAWQPWLPVTQHSAKLYLLVCLHVHWIIANQHLV